MRFSPLVEQLMDAFRVLPGVGPKTAQRMAMHLLERERPGGQRLAAVIQQAIEEVGYCQRCRTLTEADICALCESSRRDDALLCVVESPADQLAIEEAGGLEKAFKLSPVKKKDGGLASAAKTIAGKTTRSRNKTKPRGVGVATRGFGKALK